MLFNSLEFLAFFLVVSLLYFLLSHPYRWAMLLFASCYFYMAFVPVYILILLFTIIIDYFAGIWIDKTNGPRKKIYLIISIIANIGILSFFKYHNFFSENINALFAHSGSTFQIPYHSILLPIGLSFHTFQALSYTVEVYKGNQKPERHFGIYALYVMFYPQLVAGPIERPQNILHQLHTPKKFDYNNATAGLKLMAWGLFKKIVIADRLAFMVDKVYDHPVDFTGLPLLLATIFFSVQIYCDFSGYSDIALGAARFMGFDLMKNFNYPYFATSISDFWARWHISLSTWFKDYVYIPLGGNRVSNSKRVRNLLVVFLLSGIWHGANWTFVVWGLLHGLFSFAELLIKKTTSAGSLHFSPILKWFTTMFLVCIAWVFFRANNVTDAVYIISHMHESLFDDVSVIYRNLLNKPEGGFLYGTSLATWSTIVVDYVWAFGVIVFLFAIEYLNQKQNLFEFLRRKKFVLRYIVYIILVLSILFLNKGNDQQFIYFQF